MKTSGKIKAAITLLFLGFCIFLVTQTTRIRTTKKQEQVKAKIEANKQVLNEEIQQHYITIDSLRAKRNALESDYRNASIKELQGKIDSLFNF